MELSFLSIMKWMQNKFFPYLKIKYKIKKRRQIKGERHTTKIIDFFPKLWIYFLNYRFLSFPFFPFHFYTIYLFHPIPFLIKLPNSVRKWPHQREIIKSSSGPRHLSTIPLKNFHLFTIAESVTKFLFKKFF